MLTPLCCSFCHSMLFILRLYAVHADIVLFVLIPVCCLCLPLYAVYAGPYICCLCWPLYAVYADPCMLSTLTPVPCSFSLCTRTCLLFMEYLSLSVCVFVSSWADRARRPVPEGHQSYHLHQRRQQRQRLPGISPRRGKRLPGAQRCSPRRCGHWSLPHQG